MMKKIRWRKRIRIQTGLVIAKHPVRKVFPLGAFARL
jgi:hypothetical protein